MIVSISRRQNESDGSFVAGWKASYNVVSVIFHRLVKPCLPPKMITKDNMK